MSFMSGGRISIQSNLGLLRQRKFLRSNLYKIKGSLLGSKSPKRKYQSFFDKLAILILNKMGYKNVV